MDDSRPGNFTQEVKLCVESAVQLENSQLLHLDINA